MFNTLRDTFAPLLVVFSLLQAAATFAHEPVTRARTAVNIPNIPGYVTLKCDFHIHTVFSDGKVWPSVRSEEAWREGLDAIAITDHIEYLDHRGDVSTNHNRSYQIASKAGDALDLIVIKGSEISHQMPPGHLNAIFLTDSMPLAVGDWHEQVRLAHEQGGFIFWNHPCWAAQLKSNTVSWYDEHSWLLQQGYLQGIEVVNGRDYCPEAHRWAVERKLTMLSNSDIHPPLNLDYNVHEFNDHRPLTLVFAKERSAAAIKEALLARRTAVYSGEKLVGDEQFLRPIFTNSVRFLKTSITITDKSKDSHFLQIANQSDITYELERISTDPPGVVIPKSLALPGNKTVLFEFRATPKAVNGAEQLSTIFRVKNILIAPNEPMLVTFPIEVVVSVQK